MKRRLAAAPLPIVLRRDSADWVSNYHAMRPLRIAVLRSKEDSSYRVRCHAPLMWLQRQRAIEVVPPLKAWEADVVLLHGQWQPGGLAVARSLRRHGIRVVADLDEDIFNAPAEHPSAAMYRDPALQARCRELLGAVDALFVPTEHLASKLASLTRGFRSPRTGSISKRGARLRSGRRATACKSWASRGPRRTARASKYCGPCWQSCPPNSKSSEFVSFVLAFGPPGFQA